MRPEVVIVHAARADRPDEADTIESARTVAAALERLGHRARIATVDLDLRALERIAARRPLAVFNLVEAMRGDAALGHLVPSVLEHLGVRYTGAGPGAYLLTVSKLLTKRALAGAGLPTPAWWTRGEDVPADARVIVKSVWEHASYGMDAASVVAGAAAAVAIASREARFGGTFFAERFVDGREFNAALIDEGGTPRVLPVQEIVFEDWPASRPRIVDYESKWDETSVGWRHAVRRFGLESREPALAATLAELACACWDAFGLDGYARVDLRMAPGGAPQILEVNANPALAPDAGFAVTAAEAGLDYDALVARVLGAARAPRAAAGAAALTEAV